MDTRLSWSVSLLMVLTIFLSLTSVTLAKPDFTVTSDWDTGNDTEMETLVVRAYQYAPVQPAPFVGIGPGGPGMPPPPFGPGGGPNYGPGGYGPGQDPCRLDPLACTRNPYLNRYYNNGQSLGLSTMSLILTLLALIFSSRI